MNTPIVVAVMQPRAESPPNRLLKTSPDGFARTLAEECQACQSAEPDAVNNTAEVDSETTTATTPETAAQPSETTPVSDDVTGPDTPQADVKATELAAMITVVAMNVSLPQVAHVSPELSEETDTSTKAALMAAVDTAMDSSATSNDTPALSSAAIPEPLSDAGATASLSESDADVARFQKVLLNTVANAVKTDSAETSSGIVSDLPVQLVETAVSEASADSLAKPLDALAENAVPKTEDTSKTTEAHPKNGSEVSVLLNASSRTAEHTSQTESLNATAKADAISTTMLENVAIKGVRYLLSEREKTIAVRLVPPSLGELHIEVSTTGDALRVHLFSASPTVREALENHLQALRDTFAANNIEVKNITVLSGMAGQTAGHSFANPQFNDTTGSSMSRAAAMVLRPAVSSEKDAVRTYMPSHDGALNVLV